MSKRGRGIRGWRDNGGEGEGEGGGEGLGEKNFGRSDNRGR